MLVAAADVDCRCRWLMTLVLLLMLLLLRLLLTLLLLTILFVALAISGQAEHNPHHKGAIANSCHAKIPGAEIKSINQKSREELSYDTTTFCVCRTS